MTTSPNLTFGLPSSGSGSIADMRSNVTRPAPRPLSAPAVRIPERYELPQGPAARSLGMVPAKSKARISRKKRLHKVVGIVVLLLQFFSMALLVIAVSTKYWFVIEMNTATSAAMHAYSITGRVLEESKTVIGINDATAIAVYDYWEGTCEGSCRVGFSTTCENIESSAWSSGAANDLWFHRATCSYAIITLILACLHIGFGSAAMGLSLLVMLNRVGPSYAMTMSIISTFVCVCGLIVYGVGVGAEAMDVTTVCSNTSGCYLGWSYVLWVVSSVCTVGALVLTVGLKVDDDTKKDIDNVHTQREQAKRVFTSVDMISMVGSSSGASATGPAASSADYYNSKRHMETVETGDWSNGAGPHTRWIDPHQGGQVMSRTMC